MIKSGNKGFTLIELLIVIAVIAVLITVTVSASNATRLKGADAASKRDLSTIRVQANLYYTNAGAGTYGTTTASCAAGMFSADSIIAGSITHATANSGAIACNVGPTDQIFAVAVTLKVSGAGYYCTDSNNVGKIISTASASSGLVGAGATYALNTTTGLCI